MKCCEECRHIDGNNDGELLPCADVKCPCHKPISTPTVCTCASFFTVRSEHKKDCLASTPTEGSMEPMVVRYIPKEGWTKREGWRQELDNIFDNITVSGEGFQKVLREVENLITQEKERSVRETIKIIEKSRTLAEAYGMGKREETARQQAITDILAARSPKP